MLRSPRLAVVVTGRCNDALEQPRGTWLIRAVAIAVRENHMTPKNRLFGVGGFEKTQGNKLTLEQKIVRRRKVNENAKHRLGARVCSIDQLQQLAECRTSVFHTGCWGLLPAAVVMNMAASCVLRAIQSKMLFEYNRPPKT
jgi:hypothetical protein